MQDSVGGAASAAVGPRAAALTPNRSPAAPALSLTLALVPAVATLLRVECGAGVLASPAPPWAAPANVTCGPGFEGVEVEFRCPAPVATPTCLLAGWGGGGAEWAPAGGCAPRGLPRGGDLFEGRLFVAGIALHRADEVGHQIVALAQLRVDVGNALFAVLP